MNISFSFSTRSGEIEEAYKKYDEAKKELHSLLWSERLLMSEKNTPADSDALK